MPSETPTTNILVVEDSLTQLVKVKHLLGQNGYNVVTARSGTEALKVLSEQSITLVVSDVMMPEMDGFELCQAIRKREDTQHLPVLLLTALTKPRDIIRGLTCGANGYVTKPYTDEQLLKRIRYIVDNLKLREASSGERQQTDMSVKVDNQTHALHADHWQIVDLLMSTYDSIVQKNDELEEANKNLRQALTTIKTLKGMVPICMVCKKIRDDSGFWQQLESYISEHSDAEFSHGICPPCEKEYQKQIDSLKVD